MVITQREARELALQRKVYCLPRPSIYRMRPHACGAVQHTYLKTRGRPTWGLPHRRSQRALSSLIGAYALLSAVLLAAPASAQTKLKWAHVYEVAEPYHTEALWAAGEIKKRTNGKYDIEVFPASQLGNENQINEGLGLGTVDMIYTGVAFAGSIHKPIAITNAPFVLRDFDHWKAYRDSKLFRDIAKGYEDKTKHKVISLTYYGQRHITANKEIKKPDDMKGMKSLESR